MRAVRFVERLERFDSSSESENEEHRERVIRPRINYFDTLDEIDFFRRFRLHKNTSLQILERIENVLEFESDRNESVSPINQLLLTLRFYATGSFLMHVGDLAGVSASTCCRIVKKVTAAICDLKEDYIKFPTSNEEQLRANKDFFQIARFPNVIGTIDCTHVKIQSPGGEDAEIFRNRKGYFSMNVQTVSSADLKVLNIVTRWPGSTHDATIFQNSRLNLQFEQGLYENSILLGDNGYPLKNYLLTPYLNPQELPQINYNRAHITTRNTVERQYGVLKRRFPVLALGLRLKLENAINVILACAILHNICIEQNEALPPDEIENVENLIEEGQINIRNENNDRHFSTRELIVNRFFND